MQITLTSFKWPCSEINMLHYSSLRVSRVNFVTYHGHTATPSLIKAGYKVLKSAAPSLLRLIHNKYTQVKMTITECCSLCIPS